MMTISLMLMMACDDDTVVGDNNLSVDDGDGDDPGVDDAMMPITLVMTLITTIIGSDVDDEVDNDFILHEY